MSRIINLSKNNLYYRFNNDLMSDYVGVMLIVIFLRVCLVDYNYAKQLKENKVA